jgi:hypothetical protein
MCGSATFTMLASSTAMKVPVSTVPAITHLWGAKALCMRPALAQAVGVHAPRSGIFRADNLLGRLVGLRRAAG